MIAIQHQRIDGRGDLVRGCFNQAQSQIFWRIIDAVEVSRQLALGRRDHDSARMRKLFCLLVPGVAKTDGVCQPLDVRVVAG